MQGLELSCEILKEGGSLDDLADYHDGDIADWRFERDASGNYASERLPPPVPSILNGKMARGGN